mmetsp:Transcript_84062/g.272045  ORF Transcript_84062/g.272045 Transcript_84062/m.272045 type:complete len:312 (+) Transcript_84062:125-1060(+)
MLTLACCVTAFVLLEFSDSVVLRDCTEASVLRDCTEPSVLRASKGPSLPLCLRISIGSSPLPLCLRPSRRGSDGKGPTGSSGGGFATPMLSGKGSEPWKTPLVSSAEGRLGPGGRPCASSSAPSRSGPRSRSRMVFCLPGRGGAFCWGRSRFSPSHGKLHSRSDIALSVEACELSFLAEGSEKSRVREVGRFGRWLPSGREDMVPKVPGSPGASRSGGGVEERSVSRLQEDLEAAGRGPSCGSKKRSMSELQFVRECRFFFPGSVGISNLGVNCAVSSMSSRMLLLKSCCISLMGRSFASSPKGWSISSAM